MQQPDFLFLEAKLIFVLACHFETINLHNILVSLVACFAHLLLQPLNLLASQHLVVSLLHLLPKLLKLGFVVLANSLYVILLSSQPDLVESKEDLFDALFVEGLILELHVEHKLVALRGSPYKLFLDVNVHASAQLRLVGAWLQQAISLQPLWDVLQKMDCLRIFRKQCELLVLMSRLQQTD